MKSSADPRRLVVDRFEAGSAVLVADDGRTLEVERARLPSGAREGDVLSVPAAEAGELLWHLATIDEAATAERLGEARAVLDDLRKRDPGGDVTL